MELYEYNEYMRRNLPHLHPPGATLFVTFRLAGSIPKAVVRQYKAKKDWLKNEIDRVEKLALTDDSSEVKALEQRVQEFHREWFARFEEVLHQAACGPTWLKEDCVAEIVAEALNYRDGRVYRLDAYCIMSNHVHAVFAPFLSEQDLIEMPTAESATGRLQFFSRHPPLDAIMKSLKGRTSHEANRALGRGGTFWEPESYDHVVRDEAEFERIVNYILNNPVKAGLVKDWPQWNWNFRRNHTQHC